MPRSRKAGYRVGRVAVSAVLAVAALASSRVVSVAVELTLPETRTLTPHEAETALQQDWLFQADNLPTSWRIGREIEWTRELAARLSSRPNPPNLTGELNELGELQSRLPDKESAAPKVTLSLPDGLAARWTFDDSDGRRSEDISGNGWQGSLSGSPSVAVCH